VTERGADEVQFFLKALNNVRVYVTLKQLKRSMSEKKGPERVVAIAKQPRLEISRCGRFVTATTPSGM
jgi:hypothetical protein